MFEEKTNLEDSLLTRPVNKQVEAPITSYNDVKNAVKKQVKPLSTFFDEIQTPQRVSIKGERENQQAKMDSQMDDLIMGYEKQIEESKSKHKNETALLKQENQNL